MAKVENLEAPIGWLIDPHNKWAIHFDSKNDSNEKINIKSKTVEINGDSVVKFFSSGLCEIIGQNTLNFWGGLIDCADGATTGLPSKGESLLEDQQHCPFCLIQVFD